MRPPPIFYPPFASIAKSEVFVLLYVFYPPFASRAKGEVFVLLLQFCSFFVNVFSTTRGPIHAKFCTWAYSGSVCVFSPFGGWRPPAGGKRGKWNFCYYWSQWGISAFWRFLSDISGTLARIHTKYYLCTDNVCRRAPSPCGAHRPLGAGEGELKTQKIGGGLIRAADSYHFYFSQRCQMWSSM